MDKRDIKNFTIHELKEAFKKEAIPPYRAGQIFHWVYKKHTSSFDAMNNIPKELKDRLGALYSLDDIRVKEHRKSRDGVDKFLFELSDGKFVEAVLIRSGRRSTLCLSTQVGCKYRCVFCASGSKGFVRNLTCSEILAQVLLVQKSAEDDITNFVFMGMGEPLDNYDNVSKAIIIMNSEQGPEIGARRITVSTCGIIPGIQKLKKLGLQINLSVSLHAANDRLRDSLMPVNKRYPLKKLIAACEDFIKDGGRKITLEYVLIAGMNDSPEDADELSSIAKRLKAKVNLLLYSPVGIKGLTAPSEKRVAGFNKKLVKNRIPVTLRQSKGKDIEAACGQLSLKFIR
jgi:23S rRNA (adenine2503-C2)-methyltransferase